MAKNTKNTKNTTSGTENIILLDDNIQTQMYSYGGINYLVDTDDNVYDITTHKLVGMSWKYRSLFRYVEK